MKNLISTPLFGIMISLITFEIGCIINKKTKLALLNPLLISIALVIMVLKYVNISIDDYNKGGQFITFLLTPATVVLAVPLYKKIKLFKANAVSIFSGIFMGTLGGITTVIILGHVFGLSKSIDLSMIPKSITTPIGIEVSKQLGGIPSITVAVIIITGIVGAIIGPTIFKLLKIKDKVAIGVALGTACHAVGTSKAIELGEIEGAMSSLSIGIAGLITVIIAPIMAKIFQGLI
ncbi:membrane protein [Clostridium carboxidivorans P7]|uniref:LrgB family protein n=1 Tax=Clostridium carboxidivorans P7 TaxID=536227 RepID=C6PWQ1_9CLOT|nr:LrgB family protein [Clostridium carboxidivorans]AKN29593.1 membrane protein [Clostridium carboxidivorans P7]EET86339.1 LrgB family protein [Clostridium carboxidivorans P7]EFG89482.1 membrane protein, putative [Clostridium carboxidivorans P7]